MALVESHLLQKGTGLIPFRLRNVDDSFVSSSEFQAGLVLVVFTCNHCPYAIASWPVLKELQERYKDRGYRTIAINPNNNPNYPDDSFAKMQSFVTENRVAFPYLFDETQEVARSYGAQCTPDPYLFQDGRLVYHGRITDNWQKPEQVSERSLELNILSVLEGKRVPEQIYPSMGCSIKWMQS